MTKEQEAAYREYNQEIGLILRKRVEAEELAKGLYAEQLAFIFELFREECIPVGDKLKRVIGGD